MSMKVTPARPIWTSLTAAWTVTVCPTCALISAGAIVCARAGSATTIKPRAKMSVRIAVSPCLNAIDRWEHNMNIHPRQLRPVGWIEQPADSRGDAHDHALFLSRTVRRRRQQRLWAEGICLPAACRRAVHARAYFRCVEGAARAAALYRRGRGDPTGQ